MCGDDGEITLRGEVLAIGGLKEKSLAALKEGISTIVVPSENSAEVSELPDTVKRGLKIVKAVTIDDVLKTALADGYVKPADGARCSQ